MPDNNKNPSDRIDKFLKIFQSHLGWVVKHSREILPGYEKTFYNSLEESWNNRVRGEIKELREKVTMQDSGGDLEDHGLANEQLDLKLGAIANYGQIVEFIKVNWPEIQEFEEAVRIKFIGGVTRSYFEKLQRVLESILNAFDVTGLIAEFKDIIEKSIPI